MEIPTSNWPLPPLPIRCLALPRFILSREEVIIYSSVDCCETCPVSHTFHGKAVKKRARKCFRRFLLPETPIPTGVSGERNDYSGSFFMAISPHRREVERTFTEDEKSLWKGDEVKSPAKRETSCETWNQPILHLKRPIPSKKPVIGRTLKTVFDKIFSMVYFRWT